jgi:hypothetical protein
MKLKRRVAVVAGAAALGCAGVGATARPTLAATLCVATDKPGCYATIQVAVDAANDGDTIQVGPGTYAGGITIDKNLQLVGASAAATIVRGGGPVITIGDGVERPTVSISRVTITGGFNDSRPDSFFTAGGGVLILSAAGNTTGATVTISDSVVAGNRVTAGTPLPLCVHPCSFASGGGIANWGMLTVTNTRIGDNVAGSTPESGSLATDARGGGIWNSSQGKATLQHSFVTGNRSAVSAPNGRFAEGGGIGDDGTLAIEASVVNANSADAEAAVPSMFPIDVGTEAVGGGIRITDAPGAAATITDTTISDNSVTSSNVGGDAEATSGGIDDDGTLVLVDSRVDHNMVRATVPPASENLAGAVFGGIEVSTVATIRSSSVSHNLLTALSASGATNVAGGGIGSLSGHVTLERTLVIGNRGTVNGVTGLALGGGILNIDFGGGAPELTLTDTLITANELTGTPGITPQGGGLYTTDLFGGGPFPVTLTRTVIEGNKPDQCVGC